MTSDPGERRRPGNNVLFFVILVVPVIVAVIVGSMAFAKRAEVRRQRAEEAARGR